MDRATLDLPQVRSNISVALDPRHLALATWVRRRVGTIDHERRVLQIAEALFDLTHDLHGLGRRARWTLVAGSLAHDVGRCIDPEDHPRVGAEMILAEPSLNLPLADRRPLAYLTRYHRGTVPLLEESIGCSIQVEVKEEIAEC
jgi:exopolyphosphatase/pppGpp-phosphohydrolase